MLDMTPEEAVDSVAASAREIGAAAAAQAARVPGREAERVLLVLEFEAKQLADAVSVLRRFTRQLHDGAVYAEPAELDLRKGDLG
jgi:hypothetical protein